ncbi:MAG: cyclopropane-fatty-acyl-phospholipid synthase family protein [Pseudomonadota bacterium]|nr:cyclopropane-fatty-acyl-phospholipid synthase family protein [Pseudomonadota bacterium]
MNSLLSFYLRRIVSDGNLLITDGDGETHRFGDGAGDPVHIHIKSRAAERAIAVNPALKFGESYMNGAVDMVEGTIYDALALIFSNAGNEASAQPWMRAIERMRLTWRRFVQHNTPKRARRNVQHHYDLSAELYDLFLDIDRQYSCAYFESPGDDLDQAQLAKKRHVAAKLNFDRPGLKTLDIGCGWGGLGLYLGRHLSADVTGITLSDEQHQLASRRAMKERLGDRVRFRIEDYRKTEGPFDRIVSVGMFEHVGRDYYDEFFQHADRLLDKNGVMLLHTIGRYGAPANTNAFISRYIFPGGYLPALSEIMEPVQRSGLILTDVEVLRLHYAKTLEAWRERFAERRNEAKSLYDERFCRMWEFYLAASEAAFRWQDCVVFQLQFAKRVDALPITRSYMSDAEERLRQLDGSDPAGTPALRECCEAAE